MQLSRSILEVFIWTSKLPKFMMWIQRVLIESKEAFVLEKNLVKPHCTFQLITFQLGSYFLKAIYTSQSFYESNWVPNVSHGYFHEAPQIIHILYLPRAHAFYLSLHFDVTQRMDDVLLRTLYLKERNQISWIIGHAAINEPKHQECTIVGIEVKLQPPNAYVH